MHRRPNPSGAVRALESLYIWYQLYLQLRISQSFLFLLKPLIYFHSLLDCIEVEDSEDHDLGYNSSIKQLNISDEFPISHQKHINFADHSSKSESEFQYSMLQNQS
jgi:hypothetical protein